MLYLRQSFTVAVALILLGPAVASADSADPSALAGALEGRVSSATAPLPASAVYAYRLADFSLRKVVTDGEGDFLFNRLPAGLYKIIAYKAGFVPAVALLTRATEGTRQFLEMQLIEGETVEAAGQGFWSVRARLPADVLRDIEKEAQKAALRSGVHLDPKVRPEQFQGEMQAIAGLYEHVDLGPAQLTGGHVGIRGALGGVSIGFSGNFVELQPEEAGEAGTHGSMGRTQLVSLNVEHGKNADVRVTSVSNRMIKPAHYGDAAVVGFERHQVSWSQDIGKRGHSAFSARYTEENNYYRQGPIQAIDLPLASRSWHLEGSYSTGLTEHTRVEAGFRFRDRESTYEESQRQAGRYSLLPEETMDFFGRGGLQVKPAVLVEVGLYSTLRDGSLSLAPSGGVVLKLGENWRAFTSASLRAHEQDVADLHPDFTPVFFDDNATCEQADEYCYQVLLARYSGDQEKLSIGAIHRRFADTLRLYFNDDFFNHLESLYLVRGDSLPELQFSMTRQITPRILARLESNLAAGGGGILYATDDTSYENQIRYLVTSLDTRFEQSSTGVFIAFHHLAQELIPVDSARGDGSEMELERLQLMLTQDLGVLERLASEWVLKLNMEFSRGTVAQGSSFDPQYLRKRITGGIAVSF
ncbi:MAG: carboxypeptidase-like regulatory domain-containing protein [Thermoanaerobaculia bacterium]